MAALVAITALFTAFLMGAGFLWMFRRRTSDEADFLSPVTRQHIELFQGAPLNEAAIESAKDRLRSLLERGEVEAVEASLRPGTHYVVHVRALAEIGTEDAGRILERQLHRRLTDDQIEQSWYWIDLANSLRSLNRDQSLPHLLRCAEAVADLPLGPIFAVETVCFLGFAGHLHHPETPLGRSALRMLHRAIEGLRCGVQPFVVLEAGLGELIETLWDHQPDRANPLAARVFAEAMRLLRRAPHLRLALSEEDAEQEAFDWQMGRLLALEPAMLEYLKEAPEALCKNLADASESEQRDILNALADLRVEAAPAVLPLLKEPHFAHRELAVEVLTWSHDPRVGDYLRKWAGRHIPLDRRAQRQRSSLPPRHGSISSDVPYEAILRTLRGHPSVETEAFLLLAACDWDPTYRAAAVSSFGWWEPIRRPEVLLALQQARRDPSPEVRQSARAALARLGECQALQWFRQGLSSDDPQLVHETIQVVAKEGLVLLWPDLDNLADVFQADVAFHARETLERLSEEMDRQKG